MTDKIDAVPLAEICHYFGLNELQAGRKAAAGGLPITVFKAGSIKSPWLVKVSELNKYLEAQHKQAAGERHSLSEALRSRA